jgi:predicted DNA binding CopG/RHH family protein
MGCGGSYTKGKDFSDRFCRSSRSDSSDHRMGRRQGNSEFIPQRMGIGIKVSKTQTKPAVIPRFSTEAEEAAWWDKHRSDVEMEIRQRMKQKRPLELNNLLRGAKATEPITLRISKDDLATARRLAAQKGLGYQTYIKMLLREALKNESTAVSNGRPARSYR